MYHALIRYSKSGFQRKSFFDETAAKTIVIKKALTLNTVPTSYADVLVQNSERPNVCPGQQRITHTHKPRDNKVSSKKDENLDSPVTKNTSNDQGSDKEHEVTEKSISDDPDEDLSVRDSQQRDNVGDILSQSLSQSASQMDVSFSSQNFSQIYHAVDEEDEVVTVDHTKENEVAECLDKPFSTSDFDHLWSMQLDEITELTPLWKVCRPTSTNQPTFSSTPMQSNPNVLSRKSITPAHSMHLSRTVSSNFQTPASLRKASRLREVETATSVKTARPAIQKPPSSAALNKDGKDGINTSERHHLTSIQRQGRVAFGTTPDRFSPEGSPASKRKHSDPVKYSQVHKQSLISSPKEPEAESRTGLIHSRTGRVSLHIREKKKQGGFF